MNMKYLFSLFFGCLFIIACNCDGNYDCEGQEELWMEIPILFDGFSIYYVKINHDKAIEHGRNSYVKNELFYYLTNKNNPSEKMSYIIKQG